MENEPIRERKFAAAFSETYESQYYRKTAADSTKGGTP
jgi:hypothetical protein